MPPLAMLLGPLMSGFAGMGVGNSLQSIIGEVMGMRRRRRLPGERDDEFQSRMARAGTEVGRATHAFGLLPGIIHASINAMRAFSAQMMQSNQSLAKFSGQMSNAYAQLEAGEIRRQFAMAQHTAGSASALVDMTNEARQSWQTVDAAKNTLSNWFSAQWQEASAGYGKAFTYALQETGIAKAVADMNSKMGDGKENGPPMWQTFQNFGNQAGQRLNPPLPERR